MQIPSMSTQFQSHIPIVIERLWSIPAWAATTDLHIAGDKWESSTNALKWHCLVLKSKTWLVWPRHSFFLYCSLLGQFFSPWTYVFFSQYTTLIYAWGQNSYDLIHPTKVHFLILLSWRFSFQHTNFGGISKPQHRTTYLIEGHNRKSVHEAVTPDPSRDKWKYK